MSLEEELNYAYDLITGKFSVNFIKPRILAGNEHASKFFKIASLNDLIRTPPEMKLDDKANTIFVSDRLLSDEGYLSRYQDKYHRLYGFSHESAHSLISQLNHNLLEDRVKMLTEGNEVEREKGETLIAFDEGMAHYIAIEACRTSEDYKVIERADREEKDLTDSLNEWLNVNLPFMSKFYKIDPSDWREAVIRYLRRNKGVINVLKHQLGYLFASALKPQNIVEVIRSPAENFEELLYPNAIQKRLEFEFL